VSSLFIDTSAFLAMLDADDEHHSKAAAAWREILTDNVLLVSSNYVLVETFALVQNRLGMEAVRVFQEDIVPLLSIQWVNAAIHAAAVSALMAAARKRLSLVDCSSFVVMRQAGIKKAFTLDRHFREQGFACLPKF
jgi:predicted nucleic acid-binding protein